MLSVNFLVSAISSHYLEAMKIAEYLFFLAEFPASSLVSVFSCITEKRRAFRAYLLVFELI